LPKASYSTVIFGCCGAVVAGGLYGVEHAAAKMQTDSPRIDAMRSFMPVLLVSRSLRMTVPL
jgi:hypothetical protein